jgi:hypothetical protein
LLSLRLRLTWPPDQTNDASQELRRRIPTNLATRPELIVAFLEHRKELWTLHWLEQEISRRESDPVAQLLAIFDVFDGWFQQPDFEGCPFINSLIEAEKNSPVGRAAALQLAEIRAIITKAGGSCPAR